MAGKEKADPNLLNKSSWELDLHGFDSLNADDIWTSMVDGLDWNIIPAESSGLCGSDSGFMDLAGIEPDLAGSSVDGYVSTESSALWNDDISRSSIEPAVVKEKEPFKFQISSHSTKSTIKPLRFQMSSHLTKKPSSEHTSLADSPLSLSPAPTDPYIPLSGDWDFENVNDSIKFSSSQAAETYASSISNRGISRGRALDFAALPPLPVLPLLQKLGWDSIMTIDEPSYPLVVKLFYANLTFEEDEPTQIITVKSFILGHSVTFTADIVNDYLGMSSDGVKFFALGDWCPSPEFNLSEARSLFWGGQSYKLSGGLAMNKLNVDHFLLHRLITMTILSATPNSGGHSTDMSRLSCFLLYMAVKGRPVNLGYLILKHMVHSITHSSKNLPYGMLLTRLLKKEGVFLPPSWAEDPKERRLIDMTTFNKMRLHYSDSGVWYKGTLRVTTTPCSSKQRKGKTQQRKGKTPIYVESTESSHESSDEAHHATPRSNKTSSFRHILGPILTAIDCLSEQLQDATDSFEDRMHSLKRKVSNIQSDVRKLRRRDSANSNSSS